MALLTGRDEGTSTRHDTSDKAYVVSIVLILVAVIAVYYNTLSNGFVFDDNEQILNNRWIRELRFIPVIFTKGVAGFSVDSAVNYYRPMMYLIYSISYQIFGLNPWGYHVVNILLHSAVSVLVFMIAAKLFDKSITSSTRSVLAPSFIAAILFATHTIHTEPVAWVAAVPELSYSLFYLLSLYLYMRATDSLVIIKSYYVLSIISFFAATLCKEPALTLPIILFAYDCTGKKVKISNLFKSLITYIPYVIVAAIYFALRWRALGGFAPSVKNNLTAYQCIINIFPLFSDYLGKLLIPINLSVFYTFTPLTSLLHWNAVFSLTIAAFFFGGCVVAFKRNKLVFFCLTLVIVPLLPALYIPALFDSPLADRYLYLPSVGFVILEGLCYSWALTNLPQKTVVGSIVLVVVSLYSMGSISRNNVWKDDYTLWSDVVNKAPDSATGHGYLGYAFHRKGMLDAALQEFRTAAALKPAFDLFHFNLGMIYAQKSLFTNAIAEFQSVIALNPAHIGAHYNLAEAYAKVGRFEEAAREYRSTLKLNPYDVPSINALHNIEQLKMEGRAPENRP